MLVHLWRKSAIPLMAVLLGSSVALAEGTAAPEASPVGIIIVTPEALSVSAELPGRVSAARLSAVRARVDGIVESLEFQQGGTVQSGDVLYRLDSASFEAAVDAARAGASRAEAVLHEANTQAKRLSELRARNITSAVDLDSALSAKLQAEAALAEARAQLRVAEINLDRAEIKAPISGRIGRSEVTEGALVSAQSEVMTTIQDLDIVYADMQQPVSELLRLRDALAAGELEQVEPGTARVILHLDDGRQYAHPGKLLFAEADVQRSSGQVTLRAEFPNAEGLLLPGMYVRVMVEQAMEKDAIAIPSQAVHRGAGGKADVYVVAADGTAELRAIKVGRSIGNRLRILEGLQPNDRVIVDGLQKIGPGAPVQPVCWSDPSQKAGEAEICTRLLRTE